MKRIKMNATVFICYEMKQIFLLAVVAVVLVHSKPQNPLPAVIMKNYFNQLDMGIYSFGFESSDGTKREEIAKIVNGGQENESIAVEGSYSYKGEDGRVYSVKYIADENGFQPKVERLRLVVDVTKPPPLAISTPAQLYLSGTVLGSLAGVG